MVYAKLEQRDIELNQLDHIRYRDKVTIEIATVFTRWRSNLDFLRWRPSSLDDLKTFRKRFRRFQVRMRRYARGSGVYLVDEGVFQLMLVLFQKTAQRDMNLISRTLMRYLPLPDLVVFVKAPEETIEARRRLRGNARDRIRPKVTSAGREARRQLEALLRARAQRDGHPDLIVVNNDDRGSLERAASEISSRITRHSSTVPRSVRSLAR